MLIKLLYKHLSVHVCTGRAGADSRCQLQSVQGRAVASTVRVVRPKVELRFASGASEKVFTLN